MIEWLSFIGLLIGVYLSKVTGTEIKEGRKYLLLLQSVVLILAIVYLFSFDLLFFIGLIIGLIIGLLLSFFIKNLYLYFGVGLVVGNSLIYLVLIFLNGLVEGSFLKDKKEILKSLIFFVIPIFFIIFNVTWILLSGIAVGGFLNGIWGIYKRY